MQPLKDYLNESSLQYEGILDPDQSKVMNRMTDDMIRQRIREYCTYDSRKYCRDELWLAANYDLKITRIDKDEQGWYIETESFEPIWIISREKTKSFYEYCLSKGQKIDKQKGFLIEDTEIYFRWRKHSGGLYINYTPDLESTEGLPEELDVLGITDDFRNSKSLDIRNKIKVIELSIEGDIKILGKGCKNVIIDPEYSHVNITAPGGVKIHRPKDLDEYISLIEKITK